jgi:NitT/TauT family transport system ATP-binding protein
MTRESSPSVVVAGFIPLLDCAPLVVASEKGFAAREGIELALVRETSWANIRDRIVVGHFDVAHMLAPMTIASTLGLGHLQVPMIAPISLGLGGNAVTVSTGLWQQMTSHGATAGADAKTQGAALKKAIDHRGRRRTPLTFAMVYPFSSHNYELRYWLAASDIDPDRDVRLVVMPPPLLVDALREGQVDGFCVGEPWNSLAVSVGVGCIATTTSSIWRLSPEKVLGCKLEWAQRHPDQLSALLRAIYRAAMWCERPENFAALAELLSQPNYVGAPAQILMRGLANRLSLAPGEPERDIQHFFITSRQAATFPWVSHALWFYSQMCRWSQCEMHAEDLALVRGTYRPDLYRMALASLHVNMPMANTKVEGAQIAGGSIEGSAGELHYGPDGFFDERIFDPSDIPGYMQGPSTQE